jgi:hypothetical protein
VPVMVAVTAASGWIVIAAWPRRSIPRATARWRIR